MSRESFLRSHSTTAILALLVGAAITAGSLTLTGALDATGEILARAGVRLTTPTTGPLISTTTSDPNGATSGTRGSLKLRTDVGEARVYINTDNAQAWEQVGLTNPTAAGADFIFGTGWDGDLHFDGVSAVKGITPVGGVYTGPLDIYANNVIIDEGVVVRPQSRVVFINGTLSGTGTLSWDGFDAVGAAGGTAIAASITPGAGAGTSWTVGTNNCGAVPMNNADAPPWCPTNTAPNGGGASNVALNNGTNGTPCRGGGGGGSSAGVGTPNEAGDVTITGGAWELQSSPFTWGWMGRKAAIPSNLFGSQSSGGCGVGGGGGSGGGWAFAMIRNCGAGTVSFTARGGDGASATGPFTVCNASNACRCSGGGGGPGGTMFIYCGEGTLPPTDNTPGAGGLGVTVGGTLQCANSAGTPGTGPGFCCPGNGGCGGIGHKTLFSPSTGWIHTADPMPAGC